VFLFIDRLPIHTSWHYETVQNARLYRGRMTTSLPALLSEPAPERRPRDMEPQRWVFDSGCSGEGLIWRRHLVESGLDPSRLRVGSHTIHGVTGSLQAPIRSSSLWLFSNIPTLRLHPYRIPLNPGIPFRDAEWPEEDMSYHHPPILGIEPLMRAGLRLHIDFRRRTLSVWVPGRWARGIWERIRRIPTGFRLVEPPWSPYYHD
jgi:hypothetical protein